MENSNKYTLVEALEKLKAGEIASVDLVKDCFEQIEIFDDEIKAFVTTRKADALEEAEKADELIKKNGNKAFNDQPLLGIPYVCKDNFSTKGVETTASSNVLKGYLPPYESTVTQRLKDAGAILIGKTNLDAWSHGGSTEQSDFFTTKNPWDVTRLPGGSSGGTGAALAAHMTIFGLGVDTGGSIRCPASWCGITGLKPTYGRVSRYGVIAMCSSTDSPGPMTKTAEDAALILEVISGKDSYDATSSNESVPKYADVIDDLPMAGLTIGRATTFFTKEMDPGVVKVVNEAIDKFKELGAKVVDVDLLDPKYALAVYTIVQRSEVSSNLARFDGIRFGHPRTEFGNEAKKRMMLGAYALSAGYYDQYYSTAQKVRTLIRKDFDAKFEDVDVIIGPTLPSVAQKLGASSTNPIWGELIDMLQDPASMSGIPSLAFPVGFSEDLPVGAQVMGPFFSEDKLFSVVHKFQQETDYHKKFPDLKENK
jgi:aspartyl-tRNA(Asn)/glutamyl-tRNA(Gln) amidotransferase subunit A